MFLEGKVAIVTGSTRGLGFEIVKGMLKEGASVALCGLDKESVHLARLAINEENPDWDINAVYPDLSDFNSVQLAFDGVEDYYGHIDILVNNAGIIDSTPYSQYTLGQFQRSLEVYIEYTLNSIRAAAPFMTKSHNGVVINMGAMPAVNQSLSDLTYPTLRSTVRGLTRSLAHKLAPQGVRVNAISPGVINTDAVQSLSEESRKKVAGHIPLGFIGEIEDITNAVNFLASDKARYITGVMLSVDGLVQS